MITDWYFTQGSRDKESYHEDVSAQKVIHQSLFVEYLLDNRLRYHNSSKLMRGYLDSNLFLLERGKQAQSGLFIYFIHISLEENSV